MIVILLLLKYLSVLILMLIVECPHHPNTPVKNKFLFFSRVMIVMSLNKV
jgi:hypothetical protein